MNRDEIIKLAREVGLWYSDSTFVWTSPTENNQYPEGVHQETLERFAALVAAAEREASAKVCDALGDEYADVNAADCAQAIRARGQG